MLRALISKKLDAEERRLGASLDNPRRILEVSLPSFFTFTKIMPMSQNRGVLPPEPYDAARLVVTRDEDRGMHELPAHRGRPPVTPANPGAVSA